MDPDDHKKKRKKSKEKKHKSKKKRKGSTPTVSEEQSDDAIHRAENGATEHSESEDGTKSPKGSGSEAHPNGDVRAVRIGGVSSDGVERREGDGEDTGTTTPNGREAQDGEGGGAVDGEEDGGRKGEGKGSESGDEDAEDAELVEEAKQRLLAAVLSRDTYNLHNYIKDVRKVTRGNLSYPEGKDDYTLLHRAVLQGGGTLVTQILLDNGAKPNVIDAHGKTALHHAAQRGSVESCRLLLERGASMTIQDSEGETPLHGAAKGGNPVLIELLLGRKATPFIDITDKKGNTALHLAAKLGHKDVVRLLLGAHANPNLKNFLNRLPTDLLPREAERNAEQKDMFKRIKKEQKRYRPQAARGTRSSSLVHGLARLRGRDTGHGNKAASTTSLPPEKSNFEAAPSQSASPRDSASPRNSARSRMDEYGFLVDSNTTRYRQGEGKVSKDADKEYRKREMKCLKLLKDWESGKSRDFKRVQTFCDRGVPNSTRGRIWKIISKVEEFKDEHPGLLEQYMEGELDKKTRDQINKDLHRTMPSHYLFAKDGPGRTSLNRVLTAFAAYHPEVGYCQGMGFITALGLIYMPEEDTFYWLMRLAEEYNMSGLWSPDMPRIPLVIYVLEKLMLEHVPKVHALLADLQIGAALFVPQLFITGFMYSLPFPVALRIWDCFLSRNFDFLYAVAIALFKVRQDELVKMDFEEVMNFLKFTDGTPPPYFDADEILKVAMMIWAKMKPDKLRQLEGEFHIFRDKQKSERLREQREREARRHAREAQKAKEDEEARAAAASQTEGGKGDDGEGDDGTDDDTKSGKGDEDPAPEASAGEGEAESATSAPDDGEEEHEGGAEGEGEGQQDAEKSGDGEEEEEVTADDDTSKGSSANLLADADEMPQTPKSHHPKKKKRIRSKTSEQAL